MIEGKIIILLAKNPAKNLEICENIRKQYSSVYFKI